jgi:gamma-glutamylputrescine oxidase
VADPWGEPFWRVDDALPHREPPSSCDAAVIGGGFTGLSAAYHLARRGVRVAVLEASEIGAGASGRTGGLALEGTAHGPRPGADDCLGGLARECAAAGIDCELELPGCREVAHDASPPGDGLRWRDGEGWLHVARIVPGGTVHPGKLVAGLARAARAAGATIHPHTPARRLRPGASVGVEYAGGVVRAGHAIVALNGYMPELLPGAIPMRAPLTLALCTAPLSRAAVAALRLDDGLPFYTVDLPYLWGRRVDGNRWLIGAGLLFDADEKVRAVSIDGGDGSAAFARLEVRLRGLHPSLADVAITHRWGGPIAFRAGGEPLLAALPDMPNVLVAGAYAGHGVALSVHAGALLADAVIDGVELPAWGKLISTESTENHR